MYKGALLFCHLLILSAVEAGTGGVSFWRENFTMTCPENGTWFKRGEYLNPSSHSLTVDGRNKGLYHCEYEKNNYKIKYYFYVQGKVCTDCFELDAALFGMIIAADMGITIILMVLLYKCTKKKSSPGTKGPAPPSTDYDRGNASFSSSSSEIQSISYHVCSHLNTRSRDPYSFLNSGKPR